MKEIDGNNSEITCECGRVRVFESADSEPSVGDEWECSACGKEWRVTRVFWSASVTAEAARS